MVANPNFNPVQERPEASHPRESAHPAKQDSTTVERQPHYFIWLDILRGLAAISILIWHYQHFFYTAPGLSTLKDITLQPFFRELRIFYIYGATAVQLFWIISGFVFANIYTRRAEPVKAGEFFFHRFARLYPLHFMTLIVVAILQFIAISALGHYQIYPYNDFYHFVLNIFFASSWGLERGYSFNAPIWSVSVEIFVYLLFFLSIPLLAKRPFFTLLIAFLFLLMSFLFPASQVLLCGAYFFIGSSVFNLWRVLDAGGVRVSLVGALAGIFLTATAYVLTLRISPLHFLEFGKLVGFPLLVLLVALLDRLDLFRLGRKIRFLGDLTYSSYLWHVPVQILALTLIEAFALDRNMVYSRWFFTAFLALVFGVSYLSFMYIEVPSRRNILRFASRGSSRR